jgi:hypothetical protein
MSEQDADVFKILIGQMTKYRGIDPVLGKALRILGHADLLEPVRNLLHYSPLGRLGDRLGLVLRLDQVLWAAKRGVDSNRLRVAHLPGPLCAVVATPAAVIPIPTVVAI